MVPGAHILGDHDGRAHGESEEEEDIRNMIEKPAPTAVRAEEPT